MRHLNSALKCPVEVGKSMTELQLSEMHADADCKASQPSMIYTVTI